MYADPFTSHEDVDMMTVLSAQHQAEDEVDNFTLTKMEDLTMATLKKKATPAKPAAKSEAKPTPAKPAAKPSAVAKPAGKRGAAPGPREVPEGHVGLTALATEFKTTPAAIRRKLRTSDLTKPEGGWSFKDGSKELAAVRKLLTPAPKASAE